MHRIQVHTFPFSEKSNDQEQLIRLSFQWIRAILIFLIVFNAIQSASMIVTIAKYAYWIFFFSCILNSLPLAIGDRNITGDLDNFRTNFIQSTQLPPFGSEVNQGSRWKWQLTLEGFLFLSPKHIHSKAISIFQFSFQFKDSSQ